MRWWGLDLLKYLRQSYSDYLLFMDFFYERFETKIPPRIDRRWFTESFNLWNPRGPFFLGFWTTGKYSQPNIKPWTAPRN